MDVHQIHSKIIDALSEYLGDFETYEAKVAHVFFRPNNIRLSYDGNRLLSKICESYPFKHNNTFKPKHLIELTRKFKLPYYMSSNYIVVYSEVDAVLLTLIGDPNEFLSP